MRATNAQTMYTDKAPHYHAFIRLFGYRQGLRAALMRLAPIESGHMVLDATIYARPEMEEALASAGFTQITFLRFSFPYSHLNLWGWIVLAKNS